MEYAEIQEVCDALQGSLEEWLFTLHSRPETGLSLPHTREVVIGALGEMGLESACRLLQGGITVDIGGDSSSCAALRVDMDALPLAEDTGLPYASRVDGYMHACGHDVHTVIGLGVAAAVKRLRLGLKKRIRLIFQAGEETMQGARALIRENALEAPLVSALLGVHVDPQIPEGKVGIRPGQINAYVDEFELLVRGRSAHGASPHHAKDPVVAASFLIQALQTIVSRSVSPSEACVVSIGTIKGGETYNVIPELVKAGGTVRSLNEGTREFIKTRMEAVAKGTDDVFGTHTTLSFLNGSPPVFCDESLTRTCRVLLSEALEEDGIVPIPGSKLGGDDFAFLAEKVPSCMIRLGSGKKGFDAPLHSSRFRFDEKGLSRATALVSYLLLGLSERRGG
ncbi:MAG: amidohydrolase [Spirochaetes bacterium]|nr:amidohydrolase [Spirochaetota bacterium]